VPTSMPQLEGGGGYHQRQLARFEPLLGVEAPLPAQAAVVRGDPFHAQAVGQVASHALDEAPGVDEHEGGAVLARQCGHPVVDLLPTARWCTPAPSSSPSTSMARSMSRRWPTFTTSGIGRVDPTKSRAAVSMGRTVAERPTRCSREPPRETTSSSSRSRESGEVRPALVPRHRVDLVHDHGAHLGEPAAARLRGEQDEERLGRGDQHVGRPAADLPPLVRRSVTGAHRGPDAGGGAGPRPPPPSSARRAAPPGCGARRWTGP